ncbi:MAG TPA: GGDEF domain-containing protein [Deltaproteobacteria bacterium]|nr:GGDEF domain-containing protein [Deltaproteobacteria bacterium]
MAHVLHICQHVCTDTTGKSERNQRAEISVAQSGKTRDREMTTQAIAHSLIRDVKRLVWMNIIFLAGISAVLLHFEGERSTSAATFLLTGLLFGAWNHVYINNYYRRKAESELDTSYMKLQEALSFDELTGVYNRRVGMQRLKEEFSRAHRNNLKLTLAMVDIDNFKFVNDNYGHQAGDVVLKTIAGNIKTWLREQDVIFRYGGEEFLIILPETDAARAAHPLERLRERLSSVTVRHDGHEIRTSVSIGVATVLDKERHETETIKRADSALYRAKRSGRNRIAYCDERQPALQVVTRAS